MGAPAGEKGGIFWRKGRWLWAVPLLGAALLLSTATSSAEGPTIEAAGPGSNGYYWRPSTAEVSAGGMVTFKNGTAVPHGVTWTGGPERPACSGVPIDQGKTSWSGSCTFAQSGAYPFVCTVHPDEMKGTITVSTGETTNPLPPSGGPAESPLAGKASRALKIPKTQRGSSVRGSINLSPASSGGRLRIDLLARRALLSDAGQAATALVGRLVRSPLRAGRMSFAVSLKTVARRALRNDSKLPVTGKVIVMPPGRAALTLKREVVLHR